MERGVIRGQPIPDYAEFIIGPAEGGTRWLHPGYRLCQTPDAVLIFERNVAAPECELVAIGWSSQCD
jgi:hypothetical protein